MEAIELTVTPSPAIVLDAGHPEDVTLTVSSPEVIEVTVNRGGIGPEGPEGPEGPPGPPSYIAVESDLNRATNLAMLVKGMAETVILTAALDPAPLFAELVAQATFSIDDYGVVKQATFRVRRDNVTGAVLSTWQPSGGGDVKTGNVASTNVSVYDDAPTTGIYVFTVQVTSGSANTEVWSASRSFDLLGYSGTGDPGPPGPEGDPGPAGPGVAPGGNTGQALVKASGADYDTAWASAVAPVLHGATHGAAGTDPVTITQSQVEGLTAALAGKATDTAVMHLTGDETAAGLKTFTATLQARSYLLVGDTTPSAIQMIRASGLHPGTGATLQGFAVHPSAPATAVTKYSCGYFQPRTAAAAFTLATAVGLELDTPQVGAGSAVTTAIGLSVLPVTTATTNNYGAALGTATTQTLWLGMGSNAITPNGGIGFGNDRDTNLYRNGIGVLRTDGAMSVGGALISGSQRGNQGGAVRLPNGTWLTWRNFAGDADVGIGAFGSDDVLVATHKLRVPSVATQRLTATLDVAFEMKATGSAAPPVAGQGSSVLWSATTNNWPQARIDAAWNTNASADAYLAMFVSNNSSGITERLRIKATGDVVVSGPSVAIGTDPATAGALRLPNNTNIYWRKADLSANSSFIGETSAGTLNIYNPTGAIAFGAQGTSPLVMGGGSLFVSDGVSFALGGTAGTKFGTDVNQKIGFYNVTPVVQPSATPAAATDLATTTALVNDLRAKLISLGLIR